MRTELSKQRLGLFLALLAGFGWGAVLEPVRCAHADGGALEEPYEPPAPKAAPQVDQSSSNFKKTKKFLPGEEVVTPTGKTIKVWSTEGPVPVSRAPEPFDESRKSGQIDTHIVVDDELIRHQQEQADSLRGTRTGNERTPARQVGREPGPIGQDDSFDAEAAGVEDR